MKNTRLQMGGFSRILYHVIFRQPVERIQASIEFYINNEYFT
jgi:hypothetical protein